jgi:hypothetical protein
MQDTRTRWEELPSIFWDMHKDAHGFRPRGIDTANWDEATFNAEFDYLQDLIVKNEQERKVEEQEAAHAFEMRVQSVIACGAHNRAMALRWIHEAEGTTGDDQFLCYTLGLPYNYFK